MKIHSSENDGIDWRTDNGKKTMKSWVRMYRLREWLIVVKDFLQKQK